MAERLGLSRAQMALTLLLAVVLVVVAVWQSQPDNQEAYDPEDTGSAGLAALVLWLEEMGYPTTIGLLSSGLPSGTGLLVIHPRTTSDPDYLSEQQVDAIYAWVEAGGTLLLVGPTRSLPLIERFGVEQVETFLGPLSDTRQVQPLLPDIASRWFSFYASYRLRFIEDRAALPLLAHTLDEPVIALQFIGDGIVWHVTEDFAPTNLNLRDQRIASLLPAILRTVPNGATALISTHHLAAWSTLSGDLGRVNTLQDWLYTTPFGQATLLLMFTTLLFLFLQGRRLGPALPGPSASRPREAAEYVSALAGLQRRLRQPRLVAESHHQRLKSAAGRLAQLPTDLPDAEWLAQLQRADVLPPAVILEISELLARYAQVGASAQDETDLIRLVQATDALVATLPRANQQLVR
jgi:hypothetical protein